MTRIVRYIQDLRAEEKDGVIALGNFDGVHLGHQQLLRQAKQIAEKEGCKLIVMSFYPHPLTFFKGTRNVRIQTLREKIEVLGNVGVDVLFMQNFNKKFAELLATEFLNDFLLQGLRIKHIVAGHDFIFGKNRSGSTEFLKQQSIINNFTFAQLEVQTDGQTQEIFSSSKIRQYLTDGKVKEAARLLGRNYKVIGKVVRGRQEGRKLGFKTANLVPHNLYQMKYGVYAAFAHIAGNSYKAVVNFGVRPSFDLGNKAVFEAHIFDLDEDIYGKNLQLEFIEFIRPEKKFSDLAELTKQIEDDTKKAKSILEN